MASAAPYWGDLPGPNVATRPSQRSTSGDYYSRPPRRQSGDTAAAFAPQPKINRVSTQTYATESQTESSLSPYASPRESFQGQGLAPRPASQTNYPPDIVEKRRRRASKNREEEDAYSASGTLPTAPDAPRDLPLSFRHPYGNGGLPYTLPKTDEPHQSDIPPSPGAMDPNVYKPLVADRLNRASTNSNRRSSSGSVALARNGSANGHRKSSLGNELDHRLFAKTRSPLQTLELTLDSITKEEKRKRMEAAERDARERASRGSRQDGTQTPTVRFKDKGDESEPDTPRTQILAEPESAQSGGTPKRVRLEEPQRKAQREASQPQAQAQSQTRTNTKSKEVSSTVATEITAPQRNLSFRERAARNDIKLPSSGADSTPNPNPHMTTPTGVISLTRNGSNKLKKEPPGDPWYSRRAEAEKKFGQVTTGQQRGASQNRLEAQDFGAAATPATAGPDPMNLARGSMRNKFPPLETAVTLRQPVRVEIADDDLDSPISTGDSNNTEDHARKRQASLSKSIPTHSPFPFLVDRPQHATSKGKVATGAVTEAAAAIGPAAVTGRSQHDGNASDDDKHFNHEHHYSEMLHRHEYKPGKGLYNPPKYLSDWKKGTVGTLSGTMLDLAAEMTQTHLDKSSTWWETPPPQRRGSTSRPRKAEAFDGEYNENNGMQTPGDVDDMVEDENVATQGHRESWTAHYGDVLPRSREVLGHQASTGKRKARHQTRLYSVGWSLMLLRDDRESICVSMPYSCLLLFSALDSPRHDSEHTLLTRAARMVIRVPNFHSPYKIQTSSISEMRPSAEILRHAK